MFNTPKSWEDWRPELESLSSGWYNFRTGQHDRVDLPPEDQIGDYFPQGAVNSSCVGMYESYRALGKSQLEAMVEVYSAFIRKTNHE